MSDKNVLKKITTPHKITLYRNTDTPNIYYYFTFKKKSYRGSTGSSDLDTAEAKVFEIFYDVTRGLRKKGRAGIVKFEDVLKKFLEFKKDRVSARTIKDYTKQSKFLLEKFKGRDVDQLCSSSVYLDYQDWRKKYYDTHETKTIQKYRRYGHTVIGRRYRHVGEVILNRECRLLVSILRFSKQYMDILKDVQIPSYEMLPEKPRDEILTKGEYIKLKEYWMKKNPFYWYIISFINNTGIRYPSELNKIQWVDVHLDRSFVFIRDRKSKSKSGPLITPVPIVGRAKEIIEILKSRRHISKGPDDYVFVNDNGDQVKDISKAFKKSRIECNIKKNLTMYSLRHLFTTRMIRHPDIPIKVLSEVLGHKDTTMVDRRYSHLRAEDLVSVFEKSEEHKQAILKQQKKARKQL